MGIQDVSFSSAVVLGVISLMVLNFIRGFVSSRKRSVRGLSPVLEIPGLPLIGNLLQLKEKKPHKTFATELYGSGFDVSRS